VITIFNFHSEPTYPDEFTHFTTICARDSITRVNKPTVTASKSDLHARQLHTRHSAVTALVCTMYATSIPAVSRSYYIAFGWIVTHWRVSHEVDLESKVYSVLSGHSPGASKLVCVSLKYSTIQDWLTERTAAQYTDRL